ncbi:MAG: HlyD family efflux transporter periplasmic adaptor subunit [Hyphomonadaceae bacterium]
MNRSKAAGLLLAASFLAISACSAKVGGAKPADAAASAEGESVLTSTDRDYAAISSGKVDIEGGLVDIAARAPGIIKEVFVQEGDTVKKDQILAQQDNEDSLLSRNRVAAQLKQAEAQVPILEVQIKAAKREEDRLKRLIDERAVSEQAYEQAADTRKQLEAQLEAQRASIQLVRAQLAEANYQVELYVVRAPTDGQIVRRYANPGSGASTLQVTPLFQLQPDTQRIVRAEVEERSIGGVHVAQKVEIVPEADQSKSYPGEVMRIADVMGSRKLRSDDPSERPDERVVEVVVDATAAPVIVGQRVFVKFLKEETAEATASN